LLLITLKDNKKLFDIIKGKKNLNNIFMLKQFKIAFLSEKLLMMHTVVLMTLGIGKHYDVTIGYIHP
jgi:hypothetical protein